MAMRVFIAIALFVACAVSVASQQESSQSRAQTIATAFNKQKHGVKAKLGVPREKFKDVRSEPLIRQNSQEYAGTYQVEGLGHVIEIQVGSDGRLQAKGYVQESVYERGSSRSFRLENVKVEGALLTASKVYWDGATETFEGAFLQRTVHDSPAAPGVTTFGLGVVLATPIEINGQTYEKLFYQLKR
jgi:hypothetical protein